MLHRFLPILTAGLLACASHEPAPTPAPATVSSDDPLASEPWRPAVGHQSCAALTPPVGSVAELVDSAALAAAARAEAATGHVLWTLSFDGNGRIADLRALEATLAWPAVQRLGETVRGSLRPMAGEMYVRLRLDRAPEAEPALRIAGAQYCQATLVNVEAVRLAMAAVDRDGFVELSVYVDQQGAVQERTVSQSSGDVTTDRMVAGLVGGMRYAPAMLERRPVPARLRYRVDLD